MCPGPDLVRERLEEEILAAKGEIAQLNAALQTRHLIGVAQGMLMLRYGIDVQTAFDYLSRRSQDENIKLRELARRVVADLSELGWPAVTGDAAALPGDEVQRCGSDGA
jgi:AmiR/NasT family two-component response regulator